MLCFRRLSSGLEAFSRFESRVLTRHFLSLVDWGELLDIVPGVDIKYFHLILMLTLVSTIQFAARLP
jgi:hypothetical protein